MTEQDERTGWLRNIREKILEAWDSTGTGPTTNMEGEEIQATVTLPVRIWRDLLSAIRLLEKEIVGRPERRGPYAVAAFGKNGKIINMQDRSTAGLAVRLAKELSNEPSVTRVEVTDAEGNLAGTAYDGKFREAGQRKPYPGAPPIGEPTRIR